MYQYNAPDVNGGGTPSSIGSQMNTYFYDKKAIIDAKRQMYFTPLADVKSMPKNFGKTLKVFHYIPLLDDRNVNDQGLDAAGAVISSSSYYVTLDLLTYSYALDADAIAAAAAVNAIAAGVAVVSGVGPYVVTMSTDKLAAATLAQSNAVVAKFPLASVRQGSGNIYGSSRDIGTITSKIPILSETGGRVNRVGFTRIQREGSLTKFGFFTEFTQESFDFDSDSELYSHMSRELVNGATQLTEAVLQKDILLSAGAVLYSGDAVSQVTVSGESAHPCLVSFDDMLRLSTILNENRTPKQTTVITGSRMIDTKTVSGGRIMYIGSEMESTVRKMVDPFGFAAFVPISKYADAGTVLNGEIGTIDQFRIILVQEMLHWAGEGAVATAANPGYRTTAGHYDVYPMLVVGDESFATIGFQTDGKTVKFRITTKMPGQEMATTQDPYGETGFSSIKWYYGFIALRPERLGLIKTVARM